MFIRRKRFHSVLWQEPCRAPRGCPDAASNGKSAEAFMPVRLIESLATTAPISDLFSDRSILSRTPQ